MVVVNLPDTSPTRTTQVRYRGNVVLNLALFEVFFFAGRESAPCGNFVGEFRHLDEGLMMFADAQFGVIACGPRSRSGIASPRLIAGINSRAGLLYQYRSGENSRSLCIA